ncbi:MAG: hemin uptake protein HemP [Alphaproteobacteria bacterium]|nr:hemin uptake protein HemP [Alphaproteobacteria bacterium]
MIVDGTLQSNDLFRCGRELTIIHENATYRLRLTGNGKLILTK